MNAKNYVPKIINFFKKYDHAGLVGCAYMKLGNNLCIVMAQDEEDPAKNVAKIAYNCDDLQCDYDLDWYMPVYKNGEVANTECTLSYIDYKNQATWFYKCYKAMVKELKTGNLVMED